MVVLEKDLTARIGASLEKLIIDLKEDTKEKMQIFQG